MKSIIGTIALLLSLSVSATAQTPDQHRGQGYLFFAPGVAKSGFGSRAIVHIGGGGEGLIYKGLGIGAELGDMFPWSNFYDWLAVGSVNMSYHFSPRTKSRKLEPFVAGGYTLFARHGVSSGSNFGGGVNYWLVERAALRFEVRDTNTVGGGRPLFGDFDHVISFRIGVTWR